MVIAADAISRSAVLLPDEMSAGYTVLIGLLGCTALLLGIVHLAWPKRVESIWKWLDNPKMPTLLRPVSVEAFPTRVAGILLVAVGAFALWYVFLH
jgi:hypothetical protein